PMPHAPNRRWFRWSLRTMFVVVTILGLWLFPQMKWIMDRRAALRWIVTQGDIWRDVPVSQRAHLGGVPAPWQIRMLGETGVEQIGVVVEAAEVAARRKELERLFPEAEVLVMAPGPGYAGGKHEPSAKD